MNQGALHALPWWLRSRFVPWAGVLVAGLIMAMATAFMFFERRTVETTHLARVELPMWVASDPALVDTAHALVYDQCQLMWRYPYALTRADELAVVRNQERAQLNELIEIELRRHAQEVAHSEKLDSKVVRHGRTRYGQGRQK